MIFPFSIKYSKPLNTKVSPNDLGIVMALIEDFIVKKTGEDIKIKGNEISYKVGFFRMRWSTNILASVDKGKFKILDEENKSILTYNFCIYRLFIIVSIMSVSVWIFSNEIWVGILCFAWLGGMNWLTAIIRHRNMLLDIANDINSLIEASSFNNPSLNREALEPIPSKIITPYPSNSKNILFYFTLACWTASVLVNILSLADFDVIEKLPFIWILHVGIFAVIIASIFILRKLPELQSHEIRNNPKNVLITLLKGTPYWIIGIGIAGFIYAGINFSLFIESQIGIPEIKDSQFILADHGRFIKTITEREYHHYQSNIARGFSGHWIAFYGIGLAILYPFKRR